MMAPETLEAAKKFINDNEDFVITTHMSPDGDALGSALAMMHYLRAKGKQAIVVLNDAPGLNLNFVPQPE